MVSPINRRLGSFSSFSLASSSNKNYNNNYNNYNYNNVAMDQYVMHWDQLLLEEYRESVQQMKDRRSKWSSSYRLEEYGLAIVEAYAEPESEVLGEKTVRILSASSSSTFFSSKPQGGGSRRPWKDVFGKGDIMELTTLGSDTGRSFSSTKRLKRSSSKIVILPPRECLIMDVGDNWMVVGVGPTWPPGLWETRKHPHGYRVRLDRPMGPTAPLQAQRSALQQLRSSIVIGTSHVSKHSVGSAVRLLARLWFEQTNTTSVPLQVETDTPLNISKNDNNERLAGQLPLHLRRQFINDQTNSDDASTLTQHVRDALDRAMHRQQNFMQNRTTSLNNAWTANESQQTAIVWALQRKIALIRGPPGTGKTKTAALLIATAIELDNQRLRIMKHKKQTSNESRNAKVTQPIRVLAVTHSNGAADVLLQALLDMGVPAVRAGRPASISPLVQHRSVVALAEKLPHIKSLRQEMIHQKAKATSFSSGPNADSSAGLQWQLKKGLEDAQTMLLQSASVVVTSCIGAHQLAELQTNDGCLFPLVVLDEAAQCTEPALVCALTAAQAQQVILVGDTQQLPPTVTSSSKHLRETLGVSPMERLEKAGIQQITLREQYRMPPALLQHPSSYFYNGIVQSAVSMEQKQPPPTGFPWPESDQPLAFVQVGNGDSEVVHTMGGRSNPTEAKLVATIVFYLLQEKDVSAGDIAILTPYSKQVQAIRSALEERSIQVGRASPTLFSATKVPAPLGGSRLSSAIRNIQVGTVDSFQGQETDVVVFSAVRSNTMSELGFLRDRRRLCVAITRARRGLILLGDSTVLNTCRHWQALIQSCRDNNCFLSAESLLSPHINDGSITVQDEGFVAPFEECNNKEQEIRHDILLDVLPIHGTTDDMLYGLFSSSNISDISSLL
ncbi:DNA helicase [Nitzschia inconspicua]|uniref:DNA helicase n=1 Tax=Nitzschia inconspicua TaxID=303405 RepID=A0A9K3KKS1_9STRA|nr:DNA helicase [Nitzschia inconspicua]